MADSADFTRLVPGFEFLQNLMKNAGAALPGIGQWVAPTLNPDEIEKRIEELRTVQFWLEQNARMIGATIQALEVQRMTLATLKTMNVQMEDLRESMTIRLPTLADVTAPTPAPPTPAAPTPPPAHAAPTPDETAAAGLPPAGAPTATVDPMQWWGALTKQFAEVAATALQGTMKGALNATASPAAMSNGTQKEAAKKTAKKSARSAGTARRSTPASKKSSAR